MPYPYSYDTFTPTTSTTDFSYAGIELLTDVPVKDQIKVYKDGQLVTYGAGASGWTVIAGDNIRLGTAVSSGTIKLARESDIENKEVTFTNSSVLTAQDLNKNSDQLLFLCQELYDKAQDISLTAIAAVPPNSIGPNELISDAGIEAVTTSVIRDDAVTIDKIADNAVGTGQLVDLAVTTAKINDLAVTTGKINDLAVTTGKIAANAVDLSKINIEVPILRPNAETTWPVGSIFIIAPPTAGASFTFPNPGSSGSSSWFTSAISYTSPGGVINGRLIGYRSGGIVQAGFASSFWAGFAIRVS